MSHAQHPFRFSPRRQRCYKGHFSLFLLLGLAHFKQPPTRHGMKKFERSFLSPYLQRFAHPVLGLDQLLTIASVSMPSVQGGVAIGWTPKRGLPVPPNSFEPAPQSLLSSASFF